MANTTKSTAFRFLSPPQSQPDPYDPIGDADSFELHESDVVWSSDTSNNSNSNNSPPPRNNHHQPRQTHRRFCPSKSGLSAALSYEKNAPPAARFAPQSAPVNIPAWSKELMSKEGRPFDDAAEDDGEVGDAEGVMIPPHVIVARSHVTFSVFEGAGRTLKGRDLRRVRNAVFQRTGFID